MKGKPITTPRRGKKSWREKLATAKDLPKVVKLDAIPAARFGGRTLGRDFEPTLAKL